MRKGAKKSLAVSVVILATAYTLSADAVRPTVDQITPSLFSLAQSKETPNMNPSSQDNNFEKMDPTELPAIVPMTHEQRLYLSLIAGKVRETIENNGPLAETDPTFGKGKFFWPKDPAKPIMTSLSFEVENFKFRSISLTFRRKNAESAWESGVLFVRPRNFPMGVYEMDLPDTFFADLILLRAYSEKREQHSVELVNVFEFVPRESNSKIKIKMEARPDVSSVNDKYPRSFHALYVNSNR